MSSQLPLFSICNGKVAQIGLIVPDLDAALRDHAPLGGPDPWRLWTYGPAFIPELGFRGEPGRFRMRVALSSDHPQIELIESLEGPSVYEEWISTRGYGIHHLGYIVEDLREAIAAMEAAGFPTVQYGAGYGADGSGGFAYFDTTHAIGHIAEAIEVPGERRPPDAVWSRG